MSKGRTERTSREIFAVWQLGDEWQQLRDLCGGFLDPQDERILRSRLEGVARGALVEYEYIDKDYRSAYSGFYSRKFSRLSSRAIRLLFFDVPITEDDLYSKDGFPARLQLLSNDNSRTTPEGTSPGFLGAVVLRPTEYSRIGRTLLDPRKLCTAWADAHACLAKYRVHVMGHELTVLSFPHQSQDTELHSCAETALWSQFRYLSQRYPLYPERYPYDIASLNTDFSFGRTIPSRGLTLSQVASVIGHFGLDAVVYYRDNLRLPAANDQSDWLQFVPVESRGHLIRRLLVTYIESGMPPIVGVPEHAVVGFGVEYGTEPGDSSTSMNSSDYVNAVIVNDDNHAPYQRLCDKMAAIRHTLEEIDSLVVPLPSRVYLRAEEAEAMATDLVLQLGPPKIGKRVVSEPIVRRVVCTSSKNYKAHLQRIRGDAAELLLKQPLPHFIWLVEFYLRSQWGDRKVCIEVALDATSGPLDAAPYLWIRYPRFVIVNWPRMWGDGSAETVGLQEDASVPGFFANLFTLD